MSGRDEAPTLFKCHTCEKPLLYISDIPYGSCVVLYNGSERILYVFYYRKKRDFTKSDIKKLISRHLGNLVFTWVCGNCNKTLSHSESTKEELECLRKAILSIPDKNIFFAVLNESIRWRQDVIDYCKGIGLLC